MRKFKISALIAVALITVVGQVYLLVDCDIIGSNNILQCGSD